MERFAFKPGLDGLRGLAVVAVLAYHGAVTATPGGYLGVDVFLVLSGYLIAALLLTERLATGRFDVAAFWRRRLRRLGPAIVMVALAVTAWAVLGPGPEDRAALRGDVLATLGGVANWRFALGDQSYFAGFGDVSPLRHMWSLGVELQWYALAPLVVLLRRWWVVLAGAAGAAVATAWAFEPGADPSRLYYGTDTRLGALLVGAALALWLHRGGRTGELSAGGRKAAEVLGVAGLAALGWAVADLGALDARLYRGGGALVAVAAAAVVLAAVQPGSPVVGRVCSAAPLRRLGRVSYGVYLWHWPVYLALDTGATGLDGAALLGLRVTVSVGLAALSYVLVERPVRWVVTAPAAVALASLLVVAPPPAPVVAAAERPRALPTAPPAVPVPPRGEGPQSVLVVGDSVALTLAAGYTDADAGPGVRYAGDATSLGCGVVVGRAHNAGRPLLPQDVSCARWEQRWGEAVARLRPDVAVVLVGAWESLDHEVGGRLLRTGTPAYRAHLVERLERGVDVLSDGGARVVLLTTPCFQAGEADPALGTSDRNDRRRVAWFNEVVRDVGARRPGWVTVLDLDAVVCPGGEHDPGLRSDGVHFNQEGASRVWRWLGPQVAALGVA